jgi:hypothetical protein
LVPARIAPFASVSAPCAARATFVTFSGVTLTAYTRAHRRRYVRAARRSSAARVGAALGTGQHVSSRDSRERSSAG